MEKAVYSQISNLKFQIIAICLFLLLLPQLRAEDTIWNRVFFEDFQDMGGAIVENPLKTGSIVAGLGIATIVLMNNDSWLLNQIQSDSNDFKNNFFNIFNYAGDGVGILAADALLFALGGDKEKKVASRIVEGMAVAGAIEYAGKVIIGRQRPSDTDDPYVFQLFDFKDNSYPSGHTNMAFLWATIIGDSYDIGWATYPAAALCGIARIYKNAHWPSDVLAGAALGIFTGKIINNSGESKDIKVSCGFDGVELSYCF